MAEKTVTITLDGKPVQAAPGETILPIALRNGVEIPHYCYHPALSIVAQCRLCLVGVEGMPKLQAACSTPIRDGMNVLVHTNEAAKRARNEMLELLLLNHPLDCPVCDKGGECELQEFTMRYGPSRSRYDEPKRVMEDLDLGREILNRNRCVVCTRCIRVSSEIAGKEELTLAGRGNHTYVSPTHDGTVENLLSGNMADVCPVGAITTKDFRFRSRVWDLQAVDSVCGLCSRGCNISVWHKENKIYRITPRYNAKINQYWMCDIGRFEYRYQSDERRLRELKSNGTSGSWDGSIRKAAELLASAMKERKPICFVVSTTLSLEEARLLREIVDRLRGTAQVVLIEPKGEEIRYRAFWISGMRGPNRKGLETVLGVKVGDGLDEIRGSRLLYVINSAAQDPFEVTGLGEKDLRAVDSLLVQDILERPLTPHATLTLPQTTCFETSGTWVNVDGIVQSFQKVLEPPPSVKPGWWILARVLGALGFEKEIRSLEDVRRLDGAALESAAPLMGRRPWESRYTYSHWGSTPEKPA